MKISLTILCSTSSGRALGPIGGSSLCPLEADRLPARDEVVRPDATRLPGSDEEPEPPRSSLARIRRGEGGGGGVGAGNVARGSSALRPKKPSRKPLMPFGPAAS